MFLHSICVVVFIMFVGFVLVLEMCLFCPILFFGTFRFTGFESFFQYILMRN